MKLNICLLVVYLVSDLNCLIIERASLEEFIASESKNFTVHANETVHLPCVIKRTPQTVVIWNQCDDYKCSYIRNLLIVNKENFVNDLRFRVLIDNEKTANDYENWSLEIRKFGKNDEACYQCQLNSFMSKSIHYCLKLQTKVIAEPNRISVFQNEPLKLRCFSDDHVRLHNINWYKHKERFEDRSDNHEIERKILNQKQAYSALVIKNARLEDAGEYICRFGHHHDKIHVDVLSNSLFRYEKKGPSADSDRNEDDPSNSYLSMSASLANTIFSFTKFSIVFYIYLLLIIIFSVFNKYNIE